MITQKDWERYFPFPTPRKEQIEAINFALQSYRDGKDFVILDLGTGIGKSAIAITIARFLNATSLISDGFEPGSYFLTSQKILQEQYVKDFEKSCNLKNLVSSNNFDCVGLLGNKCSESSRIYNLLKNRFPKEPQEVCRRECPYKEKKNEFIQSQLGVTNYSYFLAETVYSGKLEPREVIVIDECHNISNTLSKFIEIKITEKFCNTLGIKFFESDDIQKVYNWIHKKYEPALKKMISKIAKEINDSQNDPKLLKLSERLELLDKHICKIHRFQEKWDSKNWIMNVQINENSKFYEFKPVEISAWADELMFSNGRRKLLLSATILDKEYYMNSLGISSEKSAYMFIDSPFKQENRPVIYIPAGKMSYDKVNETLPILCNFIKEIMEIHPNEKGILHTVNFKIAEYIKENIKSSRLLVQDKGLNRQDLLDKHIQSNEPTILVSPSMTEGVDLRDDLSRFQVFCKMPYPSLGDQLVKKKNESDPKYYPYTTSQVIMQAVGRSVRNEKDYAVTYILDSCAVDFFFRNKQYFPKSFRETVVDVNGKKIMKD